MARVLFAEHIAILVGKRDENVYSVNGNSSYIRRASGAGVQPDTVVQLNTRKIFGLASQMVNAVDLIGVDGSLTYLASKSIAGGRMETDPSKRNLVQSRIIIDKMVLSADGAGNLIAFKIGAGTVEVVFYNAAGVAVGTGSAAHNGAIAIPAGGVSVSITNGSEASKVSTVGDAVRFLAERLPKYDAEVYTLAV